MAAHVQTPAMPAIKKVDSPVGPGDVPCPDPSAHVKNSKLQEQASTAALHGARTDKPPSVLDANNRLSAASAATSLKYAKPEDLPGFPVVGIDTQASAGTAANLANTNKKSFEWWKPEQSTNANKAALLAKDYKMAPLWQPTPSDAGAKAALLAHKDGGKLNLWMPEASEAGNSAAGQAMRAKGLSPNIDYGYTEDGRKKALMAATGAVSGGRRRADSMPVPVETYPDQANASHNALNAATIANRAPSKVVKGSNTASSTALEAAHISNVGNNVSREMFTEYPPVSIEIDEQRKQDALRASAISMAKQMYAVQQAHINDAAGASRSDGLVAANKVHGRQPSVSSQQDVREQAMQYINLQEAAQKLAAERLAKIGPDEDAKFRSWYGYGDEKPRSRLSIRRGRRRASSDSRMVDSDDEEQSRRIRTQMSQFNQELARVDAKKRQKDRDNLLAAAERRVHERLHNMDEKVFQETGKASPAMMEEWEARARAKAAAESEARLANHGRVHIGGGKYLDQSEVDAIAAARIQPTLDEISDAAEKQRAKDEEMRLEEERKKYEAELEKERAAELKADQKRVKDEEKQAAKARKLEEKEERKAERIRKSEEKQLAKEEKRKSKDTPIIAGEDTADHQTSAVEQLPEADTGPDLGAEVDRVAVANSTLGVPAQEAAPLSGDAEVIANRVITAPVVTEIPTTPLPTTQDTTTTLTSGEEAAPVVNDTSNTTHPATHDVTTRVTSVGGAPISPRASEDRRSIVFADEVAASPPASPTKPESKGFKSFLNKLKRRSKGSASSPADAEATKGSFVGGAALTGATHADAEKKDDAVVAPAAEPPAAAASSAQQQAAMIHSSPSVSSLSSGTSDLDVSDIRRGRRKDSGGGRLNLMRQMSGEIGADVSDEGEEEWEREDEEDESAEQFEEARDTFDEELAPPPSFGVEGDKRASAGSPVRGTRFSENF